MSARLLYQTLRTLVDRGVQNELDSLPGIVPADEGRIELFKTDLGWCCKVYTQLLSATSDEHIFISETDEAVLTKAIEYFKVLVEISDNNVYSEKYGEFNDRT